MNSRDCHRKRSLLAFLLAAAGRESMDNIREILRCKSKEKARQLVARGKREFMEKMDKL